MSAKRVLSLLLAVVLAVGILTGCGSKKEAAKKDDRISISMYLWDRSMLKELSPWLEEKFPDIEFTFIQAFNTIEYYKDLLARGEEIPDTTKQEAAELAVIYSSTYKAGTGAKVAVDTTEVKNIWKASGAKPGMVLYEVYTTVYVTPREGLEKALKTK